MIFLVFLLKAVFDDVSYSLQNDISVERIDRNFRIRYPAGQFLYHAEGLFLFNSESHQHRADTTDIQIKLTAHVGYERDAENFGDHIYHAESNRRYRTKEYLADVCLG